MAGFMIPYWTRKEIGELRIKQIATWPDTLCLRFRDAPSLRISHGSPRDHFDAVFPDSPLEDIEPLFDGVTESTVIVAHTHLQFERVVGRWHIINPGSVGVPLLGEMLANYALLDSHVDGWNATFRAVPFDTTQNLEKFAAQNFVEDYGVTATLLLEELKQSRALAAVFGHWHDALYPSEPRTMEHVTEFLALTEKDIQPYRSVQYERYGLKI
jgi:predicted phosphodiesterase